MQYTQVKTDTFETLQMNAGIIVDSFDPSTGTIGNILGATTGGLTFNTNPNFSDFGEDVDNCPANTWQMKRILSYDPFASGTFLTVSPDLAKTLNGAGVAVNEHITPTHKLVEADFNDVWIIGDYSNNNEGATTAGFVAVHIKNALNTAGFQWTTSKDGKGQFAFEFHGHYDYEDIDDVPFDIYVKAGTPTLGELTVTSVAGSSSGKSKITVSGYTLGSGESYVYQTATSTAPTVAYGDSVTGWTALTNGADITPTAAHTKITVAVKNSDGNAVAAGSATIVKAE